MVSGDFAAQTWDWHEELGDSWLVWTVDLPDGRSFHTLTEYGVLAKIGLNSDGVGLLFNILHHDDDAAGSATTVPVHVVARRVLEEARNVEAAAELAASAPVSASTSLTLVGEDGGRARSRCVELWPGGPGTIDPPTAAPFVRTNHFLSPAAIGGDREPVLGPDSFHRFEVLSGRLADRTPASVGECFEALCSHDGGSGALCAHPDRAARFGARYATLATVAIDVGAKAMTVRAGGPCEYGDEAQFATGEDP